MCVGVRACASIFGLLFELDQGKKEIKIRSVFVIGVKIHTVKINYFRVS